ncbi:unnamed protein product (macronuclear) [Paramecium tetraurelia]|uniref:B box-type domain-containing protein n=1 Tax=Paramecium tetraurelia TaxID=5888 RepID=A0BH23_PARTE|nr:uncharacterized protein GSPATT00028875001 [Paramecium tetraurelia]CAK57840.1 unnamed protein product [Paramecium tetraurelia]|eukprot:XP_001425238.1 hypothetical protein (macronuclear) [Paramecium tetraurelia strain d4-2]
MSNILRLCPKCQASPATIQCIDCEEKMCYTCDQKVHTKLKQHKTDIIPYSCTIYIKKEMKQIKSAQFIISGIKDHSNVSLELQQELNELEAMIEAKQSFLSKQEQKWSTQISSLETQYEKKLLDFEKEIENNENQFKNYQSSGNTTFTIADIKQSMEAQQQQAWKELNERKAALQDKENLLQDMIEAEKICLKEIAQKEKLINQFKDLLSQQQAERDLIKQENQKILAQLESIKALCKKSLPQYGIKVDFLDKLGKGNKIKKNEQVDEQDEEYEEDEQQDQNGDEEEEDENQNDDDQQEEQQ